MSSSKRVRRSRSEWSAILLDQEGSGLSARGYCKKAGLPLRTFTSWRRRLRRDGAATAPGFVEVTEAAVTEVPADPSIWDVELALGDGMTLRIRQPR